VSQGRRRALAQFAMPRGEVRFGPCLGQGQKAVVGAKAGREARGVGTRPGAKREAWVRRPGVEARGVGARPGVEAPGTLLRAHSGGSKGRACY
jgi:hypothetical protein